MKSGGSFGLPLNQLESNTFNSHHSTHSFNQRQIETIMRIKFGQKLKTESLKGKLWLCSDLHFYHDNILKYQQDTRPFDSIDDMNEFIVEHWNSVVSDTDIVFDLGDMFFCSVDKCEAILNRLQGHIIHLAGNHSKVLRNNLRHSQCYDHFEFSLDGRLIVLNHYPMRVWNRSHYPTLFTSSDTVMALQSPTGTVLMQVGMFTSAYFQLKRLQNQLNKQP